MATKESPYEATQQKHVHGGWLDCLVWGCSALLLPVD